MLVFLSSNTKYKKKKKNSANSIFPEILIMSSVKNN